jgi:hypothetical protein
MIIRIKRAAKTKNRGINKAKSRLMVAAGSSSGTMEGVIRGGTRGVSVAYTPGSGREGPLRPPEELKALV